MRARFFRSRRVMALMHLMLFVFSSSTSLLPCAHESSSVETAVAPSLAFASDNNHARHHDTGHHAAAPDTEPGSSTHRVPDSPHNACPWVVGCAGMMQVDVDAPWRAIENVVPNADPHGATLRRVTVDRDVESPPPRS